MSDQLPAPYQSAADRSVLHHRVGALEDAAGNRFPLVELKPGLQVPDLTWPTALAAADAETRALYDAIAADYHIYAPLPFRTFKASEQTVRSDIADRLRLSAGDRVLDVGCGTGDGTLHIVERVGATGAVWAQDLSPGLLRLAVDKLAGAPCPVHYSLGNACHLSFADNAFDAAHHFGGLNTFSDVPGFLAELARVVRPGGRVVIGDEGLGPWLRDTEMGRIMQNSNPLLAHEPPVAHVPVAAREVAVTWIMLGAFWLMEFTVAEGAPEADYHVRIPSKRGGTHWSRYHGRLEGISDEAKALAHEAREARGLSMHDWLDAVVREAAARDLEEGS